MNKEYSDIVNFWLKNRKYWFKPNDDFDKLCSDKFSHLFDNIDNIKINFKNNSEVLGQIILLDQISRNIFRGKPRAYKYDKKACKICLENLSLHIEFVGWSKILFLMPLKHSENLEIHLQNLQIWKEICDYYMDDFEKLYLRNYENCYKHYMTIERFKRYPLRNGILGRESTLDELEYIKMRENKFF